MLKQFLLRWLVNFFGLWTAATLLGGSIDYQSHLRVLVWAALLFSIVNALIRPLVILLTLPAVVLSLGLFTLVINAAMLYLVTLFYHKFQIAGFGSAVLAVIIIWVVNYLLNDLLGDRHAQSV
jgi:putative membrane protein